MARATPPARSHSPRSRSRPRPRRPTTVHDHHGHHGHGHHHGHHHPPKPPRTVDLQVLGVNDLHGNLEPTAVSGKPAGGVAYLGTYLAAAKAADPKGTITVHAGDTVGASPLISSWFHDEPTIEATNLMGLDVGTLGNHEFDEGGTEMLRLIQRRPPRRRQAVQGRRRHLRPGLPRRRLPLRLGQRHLRRLRQVRPAAVHDRPARGHPGRHHRRHDDRDAVDRRPRRGRALQVRRPQRRGQQAGQGPAPARRPHDRRARPRGRLPGPGQGPGRARSSTETAQMDPDVDLVVAGHTHSYLNTKVNNALVVQAYKYGTAFDQVKLTVDRRTRDVTASSADVVTTYDDGVTPQPDLATLVQTFKDRIAPVSSRVVGTRGRARHARRRPRGRERARRPDRRRPGPRDRRAARADEPGRDPRRPQGRPAHVRRPVRGPAVRQRPGEDVAHRRRRSRRSWSSSSRPPATRSCRSAGSKETYDRTRADGDRDHGADARRRHARSTRRRPTRWRATRSWPPAATASRCSRTAPA